MVVQIVQLEHIIQEQETQHVLTVQLVVIVQMEQNLHVHQINGLMKEHQHVSQNVVA